MILVFLERVLMGLLAILWTPRRVDVGALETASAARSWSTVAKSTSTLSRARMIVVGVVLRVSKYACCSWQFDKVFDDSSASLEWK